MSRLLPEYVFRGTTYNFKGGRGSISKPYRCYTTPNPLKAYYYAKVCPYSAGGSIIYIAKYEKLINQGVIEVANLNPDPDSLPVSLIEADEEIVWEIKPLDFNKHCEGYVTLNEMKSALNDIGRQPNFSPTSLYDLSAVCGDNTSMMNINEIEKIIKIIKPQLKYP